MKKQHAYTRLEKNFEKEVNGKEELKKIAGRIRNVDGVIEVRRAG